MVQYGDITYTYNAFGDVSQKIDGSDTTKYYYDNMGNLLSVYLPNGSLTEYVLDPNGRRLLKKLNGEVEYRYMYGGGPNPIAELDADNNVVVQYIYGTRSNVPDYMIRDGITYRMITDHLGSVRLVVEATLGFVVQRIDYDEFGNELYNSDPDFQPFGYAGGLADQVTKLVKFGYRDYDPGTGRWIEKDPIGFSGDHANLYAYSFNDPVNFSDPSGLIIKSFIKGFIKNAPRAAAAGFITAAILASLPISAPVLGTIAAIGVAGFIGTTALDIAILAKNPCTTPENWAEYAGLTAGNITGGCVGFKLGTGVFGSPGGSGSSINSQKALGDDSAAYAKYWQNKQGNAPPQSSPYNIIKKYDSVGNIRGATTFDKFGNRAYQYEIGQGTRHGEGMHIFDNSTTAGYGNGPRSSHISF